MPSADFLDSSLAKIIRLRKKLASASNAVKGLFGAAEDQDSMVQKLEAMQVSGVARQARGHMSGASGSISC